MPRLTKACLWGLHGRQIYDQVAVKDIRIEIQAETLAQVDRFERPLEDVDHPDTSALLQGPILQCGEGMRRHGDILGVPRDHAFTDGNIRDAILFWHRPDPQGALNWVHSA